MRPSHFTRLAGGFVLAAVLSQSVVCAQISSTPAIPPAEHFAGPWPSEILTSQQMEALLGPVALYPDPLLAQILPASTYPLDIVKAACLVNSGADEAAIAASGVDSSVQALARYPEVLAMMDQHLSWTERLGQAFVEQPDDVMIAVQRLRAIAKAYGHLATTPQQEIVVEQETIRIVPVTEYVYVPYYEPTVVYYQRCPTTYSYIRFNSCSWIGSWYDLDCDWHRHTVCRRGGWSWRDYCYRRAYTGVNIRFNYYDDNNCERPVYDWRRDPHRHRHWSDRRGGDHDHRDHDGRGGRHGDGRDHDGRRGDGDRVPPRAAAPNPPRVTAPPPSSRPNDRPPRNNQPPRRDADQPNDRPAQREPERPSTRPETPARPPQAAPPAPAPITKPPKAAPAPPKVAPPSTTPPATTKPRAERPDAAPKVRPSKPAAKPDGLRPVTKPEPLPAPTPRPALPKSKPSVDSKPTIKPIQPEPRPIARPPKSAAPIPPAAKPEVRPPSTPKAQPPRASVPVSRPAAKPESRPSQPRPAPVARPSPKPTAPPVADRKAPTRPAAESTRTSSPSRPAQDRPGKNR